MQLLDESGALSGGAAGAGAGGLEGFDDEDGDYMDEDAELAAVLAASAAEAGVAVAPPAPESSVPSATNPATTASADPSSLLNSLTQPVGPGPDGSTTLYVTPEDNAAIERLVALGFERGMAAQAFFACDKNEELAANFLFDQGWE